jgi:hypothetical protein
MRKKLAWKTLLNNYNEYIWLIGLLHDIIEDWWIILQDILDLWYSQSVVFFVFVCSHDDIIKKKSERWEDMIDKIKYKKFS